MTVFAYHTVIQAPYLTSWGKRDQQSKAHLLTYRHTHLLRAWTTTTTNDWLRTKLSSTTSGLSEGKCVSSLPVPSPKPKSLPELILYSDISANLTWHTRSQSLSKGKSRINCGSCYKGICLLSLLVLIWGQRTLASSSTKNLGIRNRNAIS